MRLTARRRHQARLHEYGSRNGGNSRGLTRVCVGWTDEMKCLLIGVHAARARVAKGGGLFWQLPSPTLTRTTHSRPPSTAPIVDPQRTRPFTMSKKAKTPKETKYDFRDVVLAKVRGYPPWPGMVRLRWPSAFHPTMTPLLLLSPLSRSLTQKMLPRR